VTFRRLSERTLVEGHVVTFGVGEFEAPDGRRFEREVVHHPGAVAVVPLVDDTTVLLIRQFRAPTGGFLLEIPAGKRDRPGEDPAVTAARELIEEIGHRPGRLDELGEFYNSPGFCDEYSHVFLARDLTDVGSSADGIEGAPGDRPGGPGRGRRADRAGRAGGCEVHHRPAPGSSAPRVVTPAHLTSRRP
jgi:ADP-ribose pyrophosphatase